eukprot:XP_014767774.1 PREDICTED: uncharacterized protein LOC106867420 isoform X1 [Octopus bimaculoides]
MYEDTHLDAYVTRNSQAFTRTSQKKNTKDFKHEHIRLGISWIPLPQIHVGFYLASERKTGGLSYKEVINKRKLLQYSYIFQALCHVVMMMVVMVHQVPQSPITHSQLKHRFSVALTNHPC